MIKCSFCIRIAKADFSPFFGIFGASNGGFNETLKNKKLTISLFVSTITRWFCTKSQVMTYEPGEGEPKNHKHDLDGQPSEERTNQHIRQNLSILDLKKALMN